MDSGKSKRGTKRDSPSEPVGKSKKIKISDLLDNDVENESTYKGVIRSAAQVIVIHDDNSPNTESVHAEETSAVGESSTDKGDAAVKEETPAVKTTGHEEPKEEIDEVFEDDTPGEEKIDKIMKHLPKLLAIATIIRKLLQGSRWYHRILEQEKRYILENDIGLKT